MPIVPIICGIAIIAGFVALFMSRDTWRWHTIMFTFLVMVGSLVWFYLAARTLKTQDAWRNEVVSYEKAVDTVAKENTSLLDGVREDEKWTQPSLGMLKTDVESILAGRGRVWSPVARKNVAPDTGVITATVEVPDPHGIEPKTILFVFDDVEAKDGGEFLGEFEVTAVNAQEVQMTPVLKLRASEMARIAKNAAAGLTLYEIMPRDQRELLAELPEDERLALFHNSVPPEVKQEYIKDGQPAQPADIEADANRENYSKRVWNKVKALRAFELPDGENKVEVAEGTILVLDPKSADERIAAGDVELVAGEDKVYMRELRDYARLYREYNLQIDQVLRSTAEVNGQIAAVAEAQAKINADIAYRQEEKANLTRDLARFKAENKTIGDFVTALESRIVAVRGELKQLFNSNRQLTAELTALERAAAEEINRRAPPANVTAN